MNDQEKKTRLEEVLAVYGADPAKWPEDERIALMIADQGGEFDQQKREAREIDLVLNAAHPPAMPHGAIERLLTEAGIGEKQDAEIVELAIRRPASASRNLTGLVPAGIAIAACLVLGVFIGTSQFAEQYLPVGSVVAANDFEFQENGFLDLDGDGFEDGEVL